MPALAAILAGLLLGGCTPRAPLRGGAPAIPPLRVGTSGDYAPFSSRNPDGTYAGFDIEVARAYAADRRREVVFVPFRWPELGSRLAAGDFDVVMSGVTVGADRLVTGIMTATVARTDAVLAVAAHASTVDSAASAGRGAAAQPPAGFDRPARTIAVNRGGHLEQVTRARFPHARIVAVDDNTALPAMLARGDADAIVTDTFELAAFDAACAAAPCLRVVARLARDRKAYWLPPGKGALATDLDGWLLERERSGWLPALRARILRAIATGALNASPASHDGNSAPRDGNAAPDASVAPLEASTASLVEDVRRRLTLMPLVAAAKHAAGRPIEDRAREAAVEREAAARAATVALDVPSFVAFIRGEVAAAKAIQRATPESIAAPFTLDELRRAIDRADARIVVALAALAPLAAPADAVARELASDDVPGLTPSVAGALARALRAVRKQPDVFSTGRASSSGCMVRGIFDDTHVAWGGAGCGGSG